MSIAFVNNLDNIREIRKLNHWYGFSWNVVFSFNVLILIWSVFILISEYAFHFFPFFPVQKTLIWFIFSICSFSECITAINWWYVENKNYWVLLLSRKLYQVIQFWFSVWNILGIVVYVWHRTFNFVLMMMWKYSQWKSGDKRLKFGSFKISHHKVYETIKSKHTRVNIKYIPY